MTEAGGLDTLTALVRDCALSGVGRHALLLRTDLLPRTLSRPHHLRLAHAAVDPMGRADRARRHDLPGGRLAVSWRGDNAGLLREVLDGLEVLLQDAPMDAPAVAELVRVFELPRDGAALLDEAGTLPVEEADEPEPVVVRTPAKAPLAPLDPARLSGLEDSLVAADMTRFARRAMVCRSTPTGMQCAWEHRTLSVVELMQAVAPGHSATAEPWLFLRLTRLLDRRLLALLCVPEELRNAAPFGVDLNVGSMLGPEFMRFDAALPAALRGNVVLGLCPADIMADPAAFLLARDFARTRGYRLMLRDVTPGLLPALDLTGLDLEFVRLAWSAELTGTVLPKATCRWVLGGTDGPGALGWGQANGVGLFQGEAVSATARPLLRAAASGRSR